MTRNEKVFNDEIKKCYKKWVEDFRACCKSGAIYGCASDGKFFIKNQIEFMMAYLGFMMLNGKTPENLKRIKRFLSMQTVVDNPDTIELHFVGGSPIEAMAVIETLNDIDVADIYSITDFTDIHAYKSGRRRWTTKKTDSVLNEIKSDLSFDGFKASFGYSLLHRRSLIIECEIEEWVRNEYKSETKKTDCHR
jgi:hypothetical protein